jgi:DNA-binding HxlR family transcriptional regulator
MKTYGQYCPIARTAELFAERWTPLLIRNLLAGCRTFTELERGAPGISRALLTQRLQQLERAGIVAKAATGSGRSRWVYELTDKGRELKAVTDAMGTWGARWLEVEPHHVDPAYVLWATSRLVDTSLVPEEGLTVRVELADRPDGPWWLVLDRSRAEVCTAYLGWTEHLLLRSDAETLARWHLRHLTYPQASAAGRLRIEGPPALAEALLRCIRPSPFAGVAPAPPVGSALL